jgi:uracil permease
MALNVNDNSSGFQLKDSLFGAQMLFVAFGALVLVPLLTGLNPNAALFTAGAGTLLFQLVTKRRVPVFLASSFAFIAPIIYGVQTWGVPGTLCGLAAAGGGGTGYHGHRPDPRTGGRFHGHGQNR